MLYDLFGFTTSSILFVFPFSSLRQFNCYKLSSYNVIVGLLFTMLHSHGICIWSYSSHAIEHRRLSNLLRDIGLLVFDTNLSYTWKGRFNHLNNLQSWVLILHVILKHLYSQKKRVAVLMVLSTLHGATIGPLIELTIDVDPGFVLLSFCYNPELITHSRFWYIYIYFFC